MIPERVTIFSDAQAAIRHITTLRKARLDITIEIQRRPDQSGLPGNGKADGWAKLAAGESGARGVEWMRFSDRYVWHTTDAPLPMSLAHLKR